MNEICCISMGRSGTNYLVHLLRNCNNMLSLGEIFKTNPTINGGVRNRLMTKNSLKNKTDLNKFIHNNVDKYMNELRVNKKDYMFYKIFMSNNHLTPMQLDSSIIKNNRIGIVYLDRNPLSVYISRIKARKLDEWSKYDTSKYKIRFNGDEFLGMKNLYDKYLDITRKLCKKYNKKLLYITYEEYTTYPSHKSRLMFFARKFKEYFDIKLNVPEKVSNSLYKQDKSKIKDSIINYDEMVEFLKEKNMDHFIKKL